MASYAELRARARQSLKGNWGNAVVGVFVVELILGLIDVIPFAGPIGTLILEGPVMLGLAGFFLSQIRGGRPDIPRMFDGFRHFTRALEVYLLAFIFTLLWTLLFIIPGIIAAYRYSMVYYIMRDYPDLRAMEVLERSKQMMVGNKWRLFVLYLTFIGWTLLCLLTIGIGFLWLSPYIEAAKAAFYDELCTYVRFGIPQEPAV